MKGYYASSLPRLLASIVHGARRAGLRNKDSTGYLLRFSAPVFPYSCPSIFCLSPLKFILHPSYFILLIILAFIPPALAAPPSDPPSIRRVAVEGNRAVSSEDLLAALGLKTGEAYDPAMLDRGIQRLLHLYLSRGYLWTEAAPPHVRYAPDSSTVELTLRIEEGPVAVIGRIDLAGSVRWSAEALLAAFDSRPGALFDPALLERDLDRVLARYEQHGYPYCRIDLTHLQPDSGKLSIGLTVHEGPFIRVGGFRVEGNASTRAKVITREFRLRRGDPFDQRALDRGRERLLRLGLFTAVAAPGLEINATGDSASLVVRVEEAPASTFDGVLGYTPGFDGRPGFVTGAFTLSMNNLAGTGRRAQVSWVRRDPLSSDLQLAYGEPWVLGSPLTAGLDFGHTTQDSSYTATQLGVAVALPLTGRMEGQVRLGWRRVIPDSLSSFTLAPSREVAVRLGLTLDTRDMPMNPRAGARLVLSAEYSLRFNESRPAFQPERPRVQASTVRVDLEQYLPLFRRHVAAIGVHGVDIQSGERLLPVSQQFFFGGTRTLRGYRENEFRSSRAAWSNLEYRILLSSASRFFAFFDAAYFTFPQRRAAGVETVRRTRIGYGLGLRLESSLGILGLDYGIGQEDSPLNGKIHIGFSNAF